MLEWEDRKGASVFLTDGLDQVLFHRRAGEKLVINRQIMEFLQLLPAGHTLCSDSYGRKRCCISMRVFRRRTR